MQKLTRELAAQMNRRHAYGVGDRCALQSLGVLHHYFWNGIVGWLDDDDPDVEAATLDFCRSR